MAVLAGGRLVRGCGALVGLLRWGLAGRAALGRLVLDGLCVAVVLAPVAAGLVL